MLILKWLWRYRTERDALWRKVVDEIHFSGRRWDEYPSNKKGSGTWNKIVRIVYRLKVHGIPFVNMIRGAVGNGTHVKFWIDPWISNEPLKVLFPALFRIESNKWCTVAERIGVHNGSTSIAWCWNKYPSSNVEVEQVIACHRLIADIRLNEKK